MRKLINTDIVVHWSVETLCHLHLNFRHWQGLLISSCKQKPVEFTSLPWTANMSLASPVGAVYRNKYISM